MKAVLAAAVICALTMSAGTGRAATITNEGTESVKVIIEGWQRIIRVGRSATFTPTKSPAKIRFQTRHFDAVCEVTNESVVVFTEDNTCTVDGVESGEGSFRL